MMFCKPEIKWELLTENAFNDLLDNVNKKYLRSVGIGFATQKLPMNVSYDDIGFELLLKEKFNLVEVRNDAPLLTFVKYDKSFGVNLSYKHYGYLSPDMNKAVIFAGSFGIFKSTISGFASCFMTNQGFVPAHASVLQVNNLGVLFVGGSGAGKTTMILRLVEFLRARGDSNFKVLSDDWVIVKNDDRGVFAETFDPSISLRMKNLDENEGIKFYKHDCILESLNTRGKISLSPSQLYGMPVTASRVNIDMIVLLKPVAGTSVLHQLSGEELAFACIETAYHYPYVNNAQKQFHKNVWIEIINRLPVYSFHTRSHKGGFQDLSVLEKVILQ